TATDADAGDTKTFAISGGNDAAKFNIDPATGALTFIAAPDFENPTDVNTDNVYELVVTVTDAASHTDSKAVKVTVTDVNDNLNNNNAPVATVNPVTTNEDTPVSDKVTATDVDGDALTYTKATDPAHGTVIVNSDGTYTYTPNANYNGTDVFTVTISDGKGGTATITVNLTINPVNDAPVGTNATVSTNEDTPVSDKVTATDVDGDALTFTKATNPAHGTVIVNSDGTYTYTPNANYNGTDVFTVNVSDGKGGTATITVNVTVNAVNDAPVVVNFNKTGNIDASVTFTVSDFTGAFSDVDLNSLTKVKITSLPANGKLLLSGYEVKVNDEIAVSDLANLTFVPTHNWVGSTSFGWNGNDGTVYANSPASVNITITGQPNNAPVIMSVAKEVVQDNTLGLSGNDFRAAYSDADNDALVNVKITTLPVHGVLRLNGIDIVAGQVIATSDLDNLQYVPEAGFTGNDSFTWTASDGKDYATEATFSIIVKAGKVFVPEGFSPNGDGINDFFIVKNADKYIVSLKIFNRWGNLVYESKHYQNDWNGVSNVGLAVRTDLPDGTYYYVIDLKNGDKPTAGFITIKR
ncbi:MAG: Ig-like domain-containing protein, partial [Bacteroidota bacterium]|nr:Ig-like domain-containing protein [Bacteroidota bacterium]